VSNEKQQAWVATWNGFLEATEEDDKRAIKKKEEERGVGIVWRTRTRSRSKDG